MQSDRLFHALTTQNNVGVVHATLDLVVLYANPTILRWMEVDSIDELNIPNMWPYFSENSRALLKKQLELRRGGGSSSYEVELISKKGHRIQILISGSPVVGPNGEVESIISTFSNVSDYKRTMTVLHTIVEAVPDGVLVISDKNEILARNKRFDEIFGPPPSIGDSTAADGVLAHILSQLIEPERFLKHQDEALEGRRSYFPQLELKNGNYVEIFHRLQPMNDGSVRVICARDVTERKRVEERLLHADRMSIVGTLAAGVAHEINNPLTHLVFGLEIINDQLAQEKPPLEPLSDIKSRLDPLVRSASRIAEIVKDLRAFSRTSDERMELLDVRKIFESAFPMINSELKQRGSLYVDFRETPLVYANEGRLTQVFLNLMINAIQAMPVETRDKNQLEVRTSKDSRGRAKIEVIDNGIGIPKEIQSRIFEPFFTTKAVGTGTGLGLSICYNLVQRFQGEIEVVSEPGVATNFTVTFPPAPQLTAEKEASDSTAAEKTHKIILFIDDERAILEMVRSALQEQHTIHAAENGEAALRILKELGPHLDIVICDLMMPVMNGMELFERVREEFPDLAKRFVFITGGAMSAAAQEFIDTVKQPVIYKPFSLKSLRAMIAKPF